MPTQSELTLAVGYDVELLVQEMHHNNSSVRPSIFIKNNVILFNQLLPKANFHVDQVQLHLIYMKFRFWQ